MREGLPKEKGLYSQLALALYSGPFWTVSVALVAKSLGARSVDGLHCRRTQVRPTRDSMAIRSLCTATQHRYYHQPALTIPAVRITPLLSS